jgi:hypothetical protein
MHECLVKPTNALGFDIHMSLHRKYNPNYNQQDATFLNLQGGTNMTGTHLCVNKPHCAATVRP